MQLSFVVTVAKYLSFAKFSKALLVIIISPYSVSKNPSRYKILCNIYNMPVFYGEELLTLRPTPKLEDHLLSAVHDCLFSIFSDTLCIWRKQKKYTLF
jgi:hypothetical protein